MKKKHSTRSAPARRSLGEGGFFRPGALLSLLVCAVAGCFVASGGLLAFLRTEAPTKASHLPGAGLTFADRVAYQRAIEEVYWRHRIWPKENSKPKPSLDEVMSAQQIEKKVIDYLHDAQALEDYWQRPITPDQLQAEMERIASHTKQPEVLRELFAALGNDPFVIAECLVRPVLAKRTLATVASLKEPLESWRARAETQVPVTMRAMTANYTLPVIASPSGGCIDDTWTPTSLTNAPAARRWHTAVWTGSEMIVWGGYDGNAWLNTGSRYNPSTDSWTATSLTNAPQGRGVHTAVWTETEMIVWGGTGSSGYLNTGGRYCAQSGAPSPTPTATPCASVGAWTEQSPYPIATSGQAVVSIGGNVYSFGGIANNVAIANAYKYTSATNTWTPIASLPAPRGWFSATSDGTYIYLLGGVDQNFTTTATLWRYDPVSNTYNTSLPSYTIPTYFHASAFLNGKIYRIAGRAIGTDFHVEVYDIATNTWSMAANYPFANHSLMAVALGSYIYAGGGNASPDKTWRYDPSTDTWDDAAIADLPAGRSAAASGAYNGRWLLAGGDVNFAISTSAIAWDPATNTWNNLPNMVQARDYLAGATAGQSFYAVAGNSAPGTPTNDNQQYTETPCGTPTPTPTPTVTFPPSPTPTATGTFTATPTATPTPTLTATATSTPISTATPTATSTPRPSPTPRLAPTPRSRPTPPPRP